MRLLQVLSLLALFATAARADEASGQVLDKQGNPVKGATLRLEVGWARYTLAPGFDRWEGVIKTRSGTTDAQGRFTFGDLPTGAVVTILATTSDLVGVAQGTGKLEIRLAAPGAVRGKVTGKTRDKKRVRIFVLGGMGLGHAKATPDKKTGAFKATGLAPGQGQVFVKANNFDIAIHAVAIEAGKTAKVKNTKARGKYLVTQNPLVDCMTAKLVDPQGKPVARVQLGWSSRWMWGAMNSDRDGIVKLAGGAVAIGGPPYLLHITTLRGKERSYHGLFKNVKRGIALVELHPLHSIRGTVKQADTALTHYRLFALTPGKTPRVFSATVTDGTFEVQLPAGDCRLVIGTAAGTRHEHPLTVKGRATTTIELK